MFYIYVGSVLSGCCICFAMGFFKCFRFFLQCFICHQMYIANILSGCFKSRSGVASSSLSSAALPRCLLLLPAGHLQPSPPLLDTGDVRVPAGHLARASGRPISLDV
jgi:hypothetical protein